METSMSRIRRGVVRGGLVFGALGVIVGAGCARSPDVMQRVAACPKAVELVGASPSIEMTRTISNAGEWNPPVAGCDRFHVLRGPSGSARVYWSSKDLRECLHLVKVLPPKDGTTTGSERVVDVNACVATDR